MVQDTQLVPTQTHTAPGETISVTGGVAGHVAMTEDLHAAAQAIEDAATLLMEATMCSIVTENQIDSLPIAWMPDHDWQVTRARCAVANVMAGPTGTQRAEESLTEIKERLRITVAAMEEAETASFRTMSAATRVKAALDDLAHIPLYVSQAIAWGTWWVTPVATGLRAGPGDPVGAALNPGAPQTTGLANADMLDLVGSQISDAAYRAAAFLVAAQLAVEEIKWKEPQYLAMSKRDGLFADRHAPGSLADLLTTVRDVEELHDGSVVIQRIPGEDGDRFIVSIPGTQDWLLHDANINDGQADTAAMAGMMTPAMQAIVDAMTLAGIPAGAEVMLAGHSQGGINAMALASAPQFLERFNVTHVVTSGACIARFTPPPHIQTLHIQHPEDIVPGADLAPNPDRPNQTTVTHAISQSPNSQLAAMGQTIGGAHHLNGYIASAEIAESGISTSVDNFKESASEFLSGGVDITTTVYTQQTLSAFHAPFVANQ
jgi:hypothetical protein